ncbi:dihydrodipicolinate synthase family protein, partial [candidate division KSB1 bacterium]
MPTLLSGVIPALTTPFENGELSLSQLKSNINKYNDAGFSGYLVLGSTGEAVMMTEKERLSAVETVRETAGEGMAVVAGTGMQSTSETIGFTNKTADAGAQYALVVTPFYYKGQMTFESLTQYYKEVADRSRIPILVYNVPKFTGVNITLDTVKALSVHPNIAGMKESSANISFLSEILNACPEDFALFQGGGSVLYSSVSIGAQGGILALSSIAPSETVAIYKNYCAGDFKKALEIQRKLVEVNQVIVGQFGVSGIKCALDLRGYFGGDPRPPLLPAGSKVKDSVHD